MITKNEIEILRVLIQNEFRILNKKISKSDKDIEKLLKKIEKTEIIQNSEPIYTSEDIPVISYLDT